MKYNFKISYKGFLSFWKLIRQKNNKQTNVKNNALI